APYHLVVNTGLNCIGVPYDQALGFLSQVDFHRALDLKGVFTHFATAELPDSIDLQRQVTRFVDAVNGMQAAGFDVGLVHCANTAATLRYPQLHFDMVRAGIALYGYHPCFETRSVISLRPAMSVHARITDVRSVSVGESASYGLYYRGAGSASKVCTIPVGYGDGLPRALCDRGHVLYQGQLMNLVGTISMDHSMFEVDLRPRAGRPRLDPQMGDEVVLVGRQGESSITMEELADLSGTVTYERCCGFGMRLPKVYV
ncbi:MAG: alanine racemase, partial [Coriobacteriia bacterium]|nr:alanine racemase [Coriobacteriia bacterium]